jgi:hypothetical protein
MSISKIQTMSQAVQAGNCYVRKNREGRIIVVNVISGFDTQGWAICEIWTTDGLAETTKYPSHFFEDTNDFLLCDQETAMAQLVPIDSPICCVNSEMANWTTKIIESLNNDISKYETDSTTTKDLILSAAQRMEKKVIVTINPLKR